MYLVTNREGTDRITQSANFLLGNPMHMQAWAFRNKNNSSRHWVHLDLKVGRKRVESHMN
jgi:hypothetical protein